MTHPAKIAKPVADMSKDEFDAWLCALPPPPGPPATDEEFAASVARARADVAAGRTYNHDIVVEWSKTWGEPDCKPIEEWFAGKYDQG